jgi:hypothetical protein
MQYIVNTQIANIAAMQQPTAMFTRCIDKEMKMPSTEVIQSFAFSAKGEKTAKGISEKKG